MYNVVITSVPVATNLASLNSYDAGFQTLTQSEFKNCIDIFALGAVGSFIVVMGIGLIAYLILSMFSLFRG